MNKQCPVCGNEFTTRDKRRRYCSKECAEQGNRESVKKTNLLKKTKKKACVICGAEFISGSEKRKYCSEACRLEARRQKKQGVSSYTLVPAVCQREGIICFDCPYPDCRR